MNDRTLKHFLALADSLHFGRASEVCHISISALSRNIRQLEDELGVMLFNRDNRSVALTAAGQKFLKYARDASSQWDLICNELSDGSTQLNGKISVYCSVTASYSILFELLNTFRPDHPGVEIKLHTGDPEHAIARVVAGNDEISIAAHPGTLPRGVIFNPIATTPLVFITARKQATSDINIGLPKTATDWAGTPMILSETGIARSRTDAWFRELGINPLRYAEVEGYEAIVSMVGLGLGVGVVPKIVLDFSPLANRIRILDVKPPLEVFNIGLFALRKNLKNPLINAFWSMAKVS